LAVFGEDQLVNFSKQLRSVEQLGTLQGNPDLTRDGAGNPLVHGFEGMKIDALAVQDADRALVHIDGHG
jgi:hypothetical protein